MGLGFIYQVVDWIEADLNVSLQLNVRKWQSFSGWNYWNERSFSFGRDGLSFDILFTRGQTYLTKHYFHVLVVFKEPIDLVHKLDRLINSQTSDSLKKKIRIQLIVTRTNCLSCPQSHRMQCWIVGHFGTWCKLIFLSSFQDRESKLHGLVTL